MSSDRSVTGALLVLAGVFVVTSMGTTLLGRHVFLGVDAVVANDPWRSELIAPDHDIANPCIGDTIDALTPLRAHFRSRLYVGDFALWEPLGAGGSPLAAVPNLGVLSPLNLPHLVVAPWFAPAMAKLAELAVSIGFMYLFLRRTRLSRASAVAGGLVFSASGFLIVWTNWNKAHVAALIPALFWAGERHLQLRTPRSALPITVVAAVMLAEGFPAITGYAVVAWLPYFTVRVIGEGGRFSLPQLRALAGGGGALGVGAGLLAIQLIPFIVGLSAISGDRRQGPTDHLPFSSLISLGLPRAFGPEPSCTAIETSAYIGVGTLVLVAVALARPRPTTLVRGVHSYFLVATAVTIILGWVGGPLLAAAQTTPLFAINKVGRIRSLLGFLLAVLAAIGFEGILRRTRTARSATNRRVRAAGLWIGSALMVSLAAVEVRRRMASANDDVDHLGGDLAGALLLALLAGIAVFAALRLRGWVQQASAIIVVAVIVGQGASFARWFWPRADRDFFYPVTDTHRFLDEQLGHDRFAAADFTMTPGTPTYYGLRSATGRAFTDPGWADLLRSADPAVFRTRTYSAPGLEAIQSPAFDRLAVRYFVTGGGPPQFGSLDPGPPGTSSVVLLPGHPVEAVLRSGPARGVGVTFVSPVVTSDPFTRLEVTIVDDQDRTVGSGFRRLYGTVPEGAFVVPVGPEAPPDVDELRVRFVLRGEGTQARVATVDDGMLAVPVIRPTLDGLRLAFAGGGLVWERTSSLSRIRWASRTRVVAEPAERVRLIAAGTMDPDEVLLHTPGPGGRGGEANLTVHEDSGDVIRIGVDADGAGYLVVADALQRGWVAELDGRRVPLREADHALVAVAIPEGIHEVVLWYDPPGQRLGMAVSGLSLVAVILVWRFGNRGSALTMSGRPT